MVTVKYAGVTLAKMEPIERVTTGDGRSFVKRSFFIKWEEEGYQGAKKENYRKIEAFGKSCDMLDAFQEKDIVDVEVKTGGNLYQKKETKKWDVFNKDDLLSIRRADTGYQENSRGSFTQEAPQGQQGEFNTPVADVTNVQDLPF